MPPTTLCGCGASGALVDGPTPFGELERHLGLLPGETPGRSRPQRVVFGGTGPHLDSQPSGTQLVRQAGGLLEVLWNEPTEPHDVRWRSVAILHYGGPLTGPPPGPLPVALGNLREVRNGTGGLFEALLARPPSSLSTVELHVPVARFVALVARAPSLPSLEYLVVHFHEHALAEVACDELLERHDWLDRHSSDGGTVVFGVRNQRVQSAR